MTFLFFIVGAIAAYFTWKYLSKGRIEKGHGKFSSHLIGGVAGFIVWTIIIAIGVPKSEVKSTSNEVKAEGKEINTPALQSNLNKNITIESVKSISSGILDARVYPQDKSNKNNIEIEIKSNDWSGVQAWNSIAISIFPITKTLFLRNDVDKISYIIWYADHSNTWARIEVNKNQLPANWNELTYLQFFSYMKPDIFTLQGREWLTEFYSQYSSAVPQ